jgi:hypothetical protein
MRRHSRRGVALGAAVIAAGAIAGVAFAGENAPPNLSSPSPSGEATSMPSELSSSFAILRRAKQSSDALSTAAAAGVETAGGVSEHYGINASLARFAGSADGTAMWLVPGSTGSCVATDTAGGTCGPNDLMSQHGAVLALVPTSGGPATVYGIVPDNATVTATDAAGTQSSIPLSGNAFSVSGASAVSFTIHTASGDITHTLPSGRPAPTPPTG